MRVAILLEQCLAPVPGGTGRYSYELAKALARSAAATDEVTGWTAWHRDLAAARVPGVGGPRRLPLPRRALTAAWERRVGPAPARADLVHAPTPLAPPRRDRPLVVTVHDTVPWTHPETLTPRGVAWHRAAIASAVRQADRIVVPTHAVAAELTELLAPGGIGASTDVLRAAGARALADRIVVIGHGVADDLTLPADHEQRATGLRLPERFWFSLATLEPRKGLDVLVAALAAGDPNGPPLLVAGQTGWGDVDAAALADRAGLPPERVRVLGRLDDADLAVVLARATALVVPSRAEGFGLPVIEAMAAGTPVVVSDAPALVEVGGAAVVVVPREDPVALAAELDRLAGEPDRRERLAAAGLQRATAYRWSTAADRLWEVYRDLH